MRTYTIFKEYIWLVNTIRRAGKISLADINRKWVDNEMDEAELTTTVIGSTGQTKEDINPIIKHRNDIAKLYADNLEALQLTPRARYKKSEAKASKEDTDPMSEYFGAINQKNNNNYGND